MRIVLTILILVLTFTSSKVSAQINLDNVVVVAQQNKTDHRYNLELAIMEVLRKYNVNAISAISVLKDGQGPPSLANDSVQKRLSDNGFNMFMLVSVRGYDKRFLPPSNSYSLNEELKAGHLFPYFEKKRSSVTFTVSFFRNGIPVHSELIRVTKTKSPEKILESFSKKIEKRLKRAWGK